MLKTAAVSVLRFQEDSLGTAACRVLIDVLTVVIIHRCSVTFLCKFLLHARDEALIPGEEEKEMSDREATIQHIFGNIPRKLQSLIF